MKKLLLIPMLLFGFVCAQAQQDIRLEKILEEKYHPEKMEEVQQVGHMFKTAGNSETKISTNQSFSIEESEGFIAVDPTDSNNMVLSYMEFSGGLSFPVYYSTNGGQSWTQSAFNSRAIVFQDFPNATIVGGGDPVFAYDNTGKLYFSYIYLAFDIPAGVGFFAMYWASSTDNGQTFQFEPGSDHYVGLGGLNLGGIGAVDSIGDGIYDRQWMAVDNSGGQFDGRLYLTTLFIPNDSTNRNGNGTILMYKDKDSTRFSANQIQLSIVPEGQFGNVAVATNGDVHISYADFANNRIYHRKSTDGGQTFGPQNFVYQGEALFGGEPFYVVHDRENSAPTLAIGPDGTAHLAWADYVSDTAYSFYSRSTDGGTTWSTPLRMRDKLPGFKDHFMPHVAVDKMSNPSVSWYAVRPNGKSMFYNIQSKDQGVTFFPAATVSTDSTDYSLYNSFNFFGDYCNSVKLNCKTITLWSDGRQGLGPKMYVGVVDHCASIGLPELTPINSAVQLTKLYPNPATNFVTLDLVSKVDCETEWAIFDLQGKELMRDSKHLSAGKQQIHVKLNLASGTYILELGTPDGGKIIRKLVIQD